MPLHLRLYFWNLLVILKVGKKKMVLVEPFHKTEYWTGVKHVHSGAKASVGQVSRNQVGRQFSLFIAQRKYSGTNTRISDLLRSTHYCRHYRVQSEATEECRDFSQCLTSFHLSMNEHLDVSYFIYNTFQSLILQIICQVTQAIKLPFTLTFLLPFFPT